MPFFSTHLSSKKRELYYEVSGQGFPVLLFAPGGMRSALSFWQRSPWNPIVQLSPHFRVIAMDQRNAGQSVAPISEADGWHSYTQDHLDLLDHLGIDRCHVLGGCIGGAYCMAIAQAAPQRITSAVLQQTIGFDGGNREAFRQMFDGWADAMKAQHPHRETQSLTNTQWRRFFDNMYGSDFVFSVDRQFVRRCATPLLVLMGNDQYHPQVTSREIAEIAPNAQLIESWKEGSDLDTAVKEVIAFLKANTPN